MSSLTDWIGRTTTQQTWLDPWRAEALHATLDAADPAPRAGDSLPPCWHWVYFLEAVPSRLLGPDGHPERGDLVPLPRRMWAGSRIDFVAPLRLGEWARRESRVADVREKSGRSGRLCFVTVRHDIYCGDELAIREEQDIVYREASRGGPPAPSSQAPERGRSAGGGLARKPRWTRRDCSVTRR